jgi:hypothetical protein
LRRVDPKIYRLSRGPNGHALLGATYEATILPESLLNDLDIVSPGIRDQIIKIKESKLLEYTEYLGHMVEKPRNLIRKLSSFPDKEGKQRIIGVLDY